MIKTCLLALIVGVFLSGCDSSPRQKDQGLADLVLLVDKAREGDVDAIQEVLACLENSPSYEYKDWAVYYWLLALERNGFPVNEGRLEKAKADVGPDSAWQVEEWHLLPESYPPFTTVKEVTC